MNVDFSKSSDGLVPAIIQDAKTGKVLMLGYMNEESFALTQTSGRVTFWSRSRDTLWTKGETSGNYLEVESISVDCDRDTILVQAFPQGPTCHEGWESCFGDTLPTRGYPFLKELATLIHQRRLEAPEGSYTTYLFDQGIKRIAQKVGEEAVELVIASLKGDREEQLNETADLIYHLLVLLEKKEYTLEEVEAVLVDRHKKAST